MRTAAGATLVLSLAAVLLPGCFAVRRSAGGGQTDAELPRRLAPADVAVPDGYRIEPVATGLTFPTAAVFDAEGRLHVLEAGYSYGERWATPRLLRVEGGGRLVEVARGAHPPWTGASYHDGAFYVSEGGARGGGRIVRVAPDGRLTVLVDSLPSLGDHHTNRPVVGPDGWLYFGIGTATNSGVVGPDNHEFGWLARHPDFHDVPCRDVVLAGRDYESPNPLRPEAGPARTGVYVPFGTTTTPRQVVPGRVPCGGAVLRLRPDGGGAPELVAWGFRNPFGLAFAPDGTLYLTENGADHRGSRPIFGAPDALWRVEPGRWYGWPDFVAGVPVSDPRFDGPGLDQPEQVLAEHPERPPRPVAELGVHASANGLDFSRSPAFGYAGDAFVAEFGDMAPKVGKVISPVGFKVVRVDVRRGVIEDFAVNRGGTNGPASLIGGGGLERPVDVRFSPDGRALYVVDFGIMTVSEHGPAPRPGTGVVWRITRDGGTAR